MNEDLKYIFNNINDWLKFAEAKNAGLLILDLGGVTALLQLWGGASIDQKVLFGLAISLLCISAVFCLVSIFPTLNKQFRSYKKMERDVFESQKAGLNLLYFGDISHLSKEQFASLFEEKSGQELSKLDHDLVNQITNNAAICFDKYKVFNWATKFCLAAIVCLLFWGALSLTSVWMPIP